MILHLQISWWRCVAVCTFNNKNDNKISGRRATKNGEKHQDFFSFFCGHQSYGVTHSLSHLRENRCNEWNEMCFNEFLQGPWYSSMTLPMCSLLFLSPNPAQRVQAPRVSFEAPKLHLQICVSPTSHVLWSLTNYFTLRKFHFAKSKDSSTFMLYNHLNCCHWCLQKKFTHVGQII